jgi:dTDP-4-amino-4,6-dideoxygalactose transaminase
VSGDRIFLSAPDVGPDERQALLDAFDGGWIAPVGPDLDAFEREIAAATGRRAAVGLSSGTAALHLALLTEGVSPGDDVVVSTFTFAATVNAIRYLDATPVLVDSERASWNMDPQLLHDVLAARAAAGRLPAAVVTVDLYGQCADYEAIEAICARYEVPLLEDAAEALGAAAAGGRPAGSIGSAAAVSFNGNKIITTSGGGMFVTDDEERAAHVRYLATQARQPVAHYEHVDVGYNYRLSNLLAALGRAQLGRLPAMIARRHEINARYRRELEGRLDLTFMPVAPWGTWNGWLTCVVFDRPGDHLDAMRRLAAVDIEARPLWKPMHRQPVFAGSEAHLSGVSDHLYERGLCLPSGSALTDADVDRVVDALLAR